MSQISRSLRLRTALLLAAASAVAFGACGAPGGAQAAVMPLPAGEAGVVWGWGSNLWGQVGRPNIGYVVAQPEAVELPAGVKLVEVSTGYSHTIALSSTGEVYVWGEDKHGQLGPVSEATASAKQTATPERIVLPGQPQVAQVAACAFYSLVLTAKGEVLAMGSDLYGTLGDAKSDYEAHPAPVKVAVPAASMVSCGGDFALALTTGGQVYAWGANYDGELGFEPTSREAPLPVYAPAEISIPGRVVEVASSDASGPEYALALTESGEVYGWGGNYYGELGIGKMGTEFYGEYGIGIEASPVRAVLPPETFVTQISAAGEDSGHSIALTSTGEVLSWGAGVNSVPTPMELPGGAPARQVLADGHSLFELTTGGVLYSEGDNGDGEGGLGVGVYETSTPPGVSKTPTEVQVPAGMKVAQVSGGYDQALAILAPLVGAAPTVTALSPDHGPPAGGNTVTVSGEGFMPGAVVTFGTQTATSVSVRSSHTLTATAPAGSGTVDVHVTLNASTSPASAGDRYTYDGTAKAPAPAQSEEGAGQPSEGKGHGKGKGKGGGATPHAVRHGRSAAVSGAVERLKLSNPNSYPLHAKVTEVIRSGKRSVTIAAGGATIPAKGSATVRLKLTKAGRARLKARRRLRATLRISLSAKGHGGVKERGSVTLVRAHRHSARRHARRRGHGASADRPMARIPPCAAPSASRSRTGQSARSRRRTRAACGPGRLR